MNADSNRTRRSSGIARLGAGVALGGGTRLLLRRMASDFERDQRLRPSTTVGVYGAYVIQLVALADLARRPTLRVPIPPLVGRVFGGSLITAGSVVLAAGASTFGSAKQLSGTETGHLIETGIYRWSRNPQYLGYLAILTGAGLAKGSLDATLTTAASVVVFDHWIGHEEANLRRTFGSDYTRYRERTARWLRVPTRS